jgi:Zn-dependent protease with chaperone function
VTDPIEALLFDGRNARPRPVSLRVDGDQLSAASRGEDDVPVVWQWPLRQVQWPEQTRHGQRVIALRSGERLQAVSAADFDAWTASLGHRDGLVVRMQRSWRATLAALVALLVVLAAAYQWGVPLAARAVLVFVPEAVDRAVGEQVFEAVKAQWFKPSRVPPGQQAQIRRAFASALTAAYPGLSASSIRDQPESASTQRPDQARAPQPWRIEFRAADKALGPNAMALPGGTIIVTDALVELLADRPDALLGVLGHEWGHVRLRHGMQGLARAAFVAAAAGLVLGDFSTLLSAAPVLLVQLAYSRHFEREADVESVRMLRASGHSPRAMVEFFQRLDRSLGDRLVPVALASHPDNAERVRFFEDAARH